MQVTTTQAVRKEDHSLVLPCSQVWLGDHRTNLTPDGCTGQILRWGLECCRSRPPVLPAARKGANLIRRCPWCQPALPRRTRPLPPSFPSENQSPIINTSHFTKTIWSYVVRDINNVEFCWLASFRVCADAQTGASCTFFAPKIRTDRVMKCGSPVVTPGPDKGKRRCAAAVGLCGSASLLLCRSSSHIRAARTTARRSTHSLLFIYFFILSISL